MYRDTSSVDCAPNNLVVLYNMVCIVVNIELYQCLYSGMSEDATKGMFRM